MHTGESRIRYAVAIIDTDVCVYIIITMMS